MLPSGRPYALAALLLLACSDSEAAPGPERADPPNSRMRHSGEIIRHDYGTILHGSVASARIPIPVPEDRADMIPLAFRRNCSCAREHFVIVSPDGSERIPNGQPDPRFALRDGESLWLELSLHTDQLESEDLERTAVSGDVVLQEEVAPFRQELVRVEFHYAVETPIRVLPYPHLKLKSAPIGSVYEQDFELDTRGATLEFGDPRVFVPDEGEGHSDPDVSATLVEQDGQRATLRLRFAPSPGRLPGPFLARIEVPTDSAEGYCANLTISGAVVPEIQLGPPEKFSFGQIRFDRPFEQMLEITDHDRRRSADFYLLRIEDPQGEDLSAHFDFECVEIPGAPRTRQLRLRYKGTIEFAGRRYGGLVRLAKEPGGPEVFQVELVAFRRRSE